VCTKSLKCSINQPLWNAECPSITYIVDISINQDGKDELALICINIVSIVGAGAFTIHVYDSENDTNNMSKGINDSI
jgi:hypothetical protein